MKRKSKAEVIVLQLLTHHKKLVYHSLNPSSSENVTIATLRLLTAIVMHGPVLAREILSAIELSHKTFVSLARRCNKKVITYICISDFPSSMKSSLQLRFSLKLVYSITRQIWMCEHVL